MLNWLFNWLDPKILQLERWVNYKTIEPDKLNIDWDKVKKGEVRETEMFNKILPDAATTHEKLGPFVINLQNAKLMSLMYGPGEVEAFALYQQGHKLWWRHRDGGTTHDFRVAAFDDMQEFVGFIDSDINFWECVLRTEARISGFKDNSERLQVSEVKEFIKKYDE